MASENKIRRIAVWVVSVLLTVVFLIAGATKLPGKAVGMFGHWGYPAWFSYAVGAVEVVSAALLLIPKAASLGGAAFGSGSWPEPFSPISGATNGTTSQGSWVYWSWLPSSLTPGASICSEHPLVPRAI
jgi:uncharacterized membrane protein YphA (DoxX/SURF4 family)